MSDNDLERQLGVAKLFVAQLTRLLDYNRGLVVALTDDNERLRAELAIANAAREILRNADGTVRSGVCCPCCASGLDRGTTVLCPACHHAWVAHNAPEPCPCCKRGLHHGSASAMMDECPTCGHPGFAHKSIVAECRCCAAGLDHGITPATWECLRCGHKVPAHVNTRTDKGDE